MLNSDIRTEVIYIYGEAFKCQKELFYIVGASRDLLHFHILQLLKSFLYLAHI